MYLKSMSIVGFKTFADETEVVFDPGFTAVVGRMVLENLIL